jgi:2-dehydro-3-deoxygluconokinase
MSKEKLEFNITKDDLSQFHGKGSAFVTFGECMIRETPMDMQRLEMTRQVYLSMAGSEYTLAMGLARLGIPSSYITRLPDNPYGWMMRDMARSQGINTDYLVWAPSAEPIGRLLYEMGRTPRKGVAYYQRMYSAASRLSSGMVDWKSALKDCRIFHTSGITFGLANHSNYECNYLLDTFHEAMAARPPATLTGLDFNYRASLWSQEQCKAVMTPLVAEHIDILITTIEDMAVLYGIPCGQYSAEQIDKGDIGELTDADIKDFIERVGEMFKTRIVAITIRYPDTFEQNRWETAAMNSAGHFFRSPSVKSVVLMDRLGGGDTWNSGFYYGLLTEGFDLMGIKKGLLVGDAATRIKQTLMFDLPVVTRNEIHDLMKADVLGGGKRVVR